MSEAPIIKTAFVIGADHLDPDEVSSKVGLEPVSVWRQRGQPSRQIEGVPNTQWILELEARDLFSVSEALDKLLDALWPVRDRIQFFTSSPDYQCWFSTSVTVYQDRPLYELQPDVIKRLAFFGCGWSLDIFDHSQ